MLVGGGHWVGRTGNVVVDGLRILVVNVVIVGVDIVAVVVTIIRWSKDNGKKTCWAVCCWIELTITS